MGNTLNSFAGVAIVLAIVIFGNVAVNKVNLRVDVTEGNLFTLSEGSKNIIKGLKEDVTMTFYFSENLEGMDEAEKIYAKRVENLLEEYRVYSDKISLKIVNPEPDSESEELAQRYGVTASPTPFGENSYFGLVVSSSASEQTETINRFNPQRENFLEYDITRSIYLLNLGDNKIKVGVLSSLAVLGDDAPEQRNPFAPPPQPKNPAWLFTMELKRMYNVVKIEDTADKIPDDIKLLVVMHGKDITPKTAYAVDQYVLSGHNAIFFVDPFYLKDQQQQQQYQPPATNTSFNNLFERWGIEYKPEKIALDPVTAALVPTRNGNEKHPAILQIGTANVATGDVSTAQLNQVVMLFAGSLGKNTFDNTKDIKFTPLMFTSNSAKDEEKTKVMYSQPSNLMSELRSGGGQKVVAALYEGKFKSGFDEPPEKSMSATHKKEAVSEGAVMVVADMDMLEDQYCIRPVEFFGQTLGYQPINQNSIFFNNAVEKMVGSKELISLRSRGKFRRPFEKVDMLEADARKKFQDKEDELQKKIQDVQAKINEKLKNVDPSQNTIVSGEVQKEIESFKKDKLKFSQELRDVRRKLRSNIDNLGYYLKTINMFLVPLLIGILGLFVALSKSRRVGT